MAKQTNRMEISRPPPPPYLSKETLIIWEGWSKKGDREVAREAAVKGSHTDLALTFLSQRKGLCVDETKAWFTNEILQWALELLMNKQIFRASHIIKNIQLEPAKEIVRIFEETTSEELRDFLGNHLVKNVEIDDELILSWELLKIMKADQELVEGVSYEDSCVKFIKEKDKEWKYQVAADMFLKCHDYVLKPLLSAPHLWKSALKNDNVELLSNWINLHYSDSNFETTNELSNLLTNLTINDDMLNSVLLSQNETCDKLCDTLLEFGIIKNDEKTDAIKLIKRFARTNNLTQIENILNNKKSHLNIIEFKELIYNYCLQKEFYVILEICTKNFIAPNETDPVKLMRLNQQLELNDPISLRDNLIGNLNYLQIYNGLILLFTLMITECDLMEILTDGSLIFDELKLLSIVFNKLKGNNIKNRLNPYDLLKRHARLNVENLFANRFESNFQHFNSIDLSNQYGYKKEIDYKFFIRHNRPNKAILYSQEHDAHKIATIAKQHYNRMDVTTSCIAFLEQNGFNSDCLRIEIFMASSIGSEFKFLPKYNKNILLNQFEEVLIANFVQSNDAIKAIRNYNVAVKYSNYYNLKLPQLLPIKFAELNLWLPFIIFIQLYNYPQDDVGKLVQNFQDEKLLEHLYHCLMHDIQFENTLMRDRDSRKYYLSKIGVRKNVENDAMVTSITSQSSFSSTSSSCLSDYDDCLEAKSDLLQILIKCHNSNDPPRALLQACSYYKYPLLAVLATSYEPDSVITSWLNWLAVTCEIENSVNFDSIATVGTKVSDFLATIMKNGYCKTLLQSFNIFLTENPLKKFMNFLNDCINLNFETIKSKEQLDQFHHQLKFKRSNSFISEFDHELIYINNKSWIENTALLLFSTTLQHNFKTLYHKLCFLELISKLEFENYFLTDLTNLKNLLQIVRYLFERRIDAKLDFINLCNVNCYKQEIANLINDLVSENKFEEALNLAEIEYLETDTILLKKWTLMISTDNLLDCDSEFKKYNIKPSNAVKFYMNYNLNDDLEQYQVLKLAHKWAYKYKVDELNVVETKLWNVYLRLDIVDNILTNDNYKLYSDMKEVLKNILVDDELVLSQKEILRFETVVEQLLEAGNVFQPFRLEILFNQKNINLDILKLCFNLAEGITLPFQLNAQERLLLRKGSAVRSFSHRRKTFLSTRLSSFSTVSRSPCGSSVGTMLMEVESTVQDTLSLIENLVENLSSGMEIGQNILMTYRISCNIDRLYRDIAETTEPMRLLLDALEGDCRNKLEVVHDFIYIYKWSKREIADFLCEQMINVVMQKTQSKAETYLMWDINLDKDMHVILQLLPDSCSILGTKLYNYANALHKAHTVVNDYPSLLEITYVIELLIRAHDCYTSDCNMEGISIILKKCQTMTNLLLTMKNWQLIVRLLTGIGRYNELNYIFHILRENDQFEFLLRKGKSNVRDNGLKVALLGYLKKFCPDNRELYKMVALHFTLYSEVAQLWENESKSIVRNLIAISKLEMQNRKVNPEACLFVELTNTDGTKLCLNKAMENYNHAAEYHLQGEKLASAMNAARQAELIALQMSMLKGLNSNGTATCVLNLNPTQITSIVAANLSFAQSLILTEAYNYQIDWAIILYEQYILQSGSDYLDHFLSVFPLTDNLVYDISRRVLSSNINDECSLGNMREILKRLPSVHTKYRIASEFGFLDLVEELLNGNSLIYLKDTVWKKGYRD